MSHTTFTSDIINLNVGGTRFSTSRQTLSSPQESFFTSMLSGRIPTCRDETGALFIDRDPKLFSVILHFLRTKELDLNGVDVSVLRHEAEFYGIVPLVKRLILCEDLDRSLCGDVLFTGFIPKPKLTESTTNNFPNNTNQSNFPPGKSSKPTNPGEYRPGNVLRLNNNTLINSGSSSNGASTTNPANMAGIGHSRTSSVTDFVNKSHSRTSSFECSSSNAYLYQPNHFSHSRNQSLEIKQMKTDLDSCSIDGTYLEKNSNQVNIIVGHHNWISVAYLHVVCCYKLKDGIGWQLMFQSAYIEEEIDRLAINSKHQMTSVSASPGHLNSPTTATNNSPNQNNQANQASNLTQVNIPNPNSLIPNVESPNSKLCALLAIALDTMVKLWLVNDESSTVLIGNFCLNAPCDNLFFIGSQLVATSSIGKIGVWNSLSQLWQSQDISPISSFDTAGSFLLLGGQNGILYLIDMQKFPLRMKDNDLLVTELYKDPAGDAITAISVYLTPKTSNTGNWIEIAYGTSTGQVRVIVQHPETVGHGPQLFQTFSVHRGSVIKVMLTEKHLVSVCSEFNHVRSWTVTRFRGMISTQPGSTPLASFKIVTIDALDAPISYTLGNNIGPFGERDNHQVFIQKVVPYTDQVFVRLSSTGKRICTIKSVDYSTITSFCVHECEGPSRLNSRPRRYLFTGHSNGGIQLWDLTTALELKPCDQNYLGGPSATEFVRLLDQCDLASNSGSGYSTPCMSPCTNLSSLNKLNGKNLLANSLASQIVHNVQNTNSGPFLDEP